jgi:quinol monooxygenase YgiN
MTVVAHLDVRLQPDSLDKAHQVLREILAQTRAFDGCLGVDVLIDKDDPAHVVAHERWASIEHDAAYRAWRATEAGANDLGTVLAAVPTLTIFTLADDI